MSESPQQPMNRRRFLTVVGASGAGAAVLSGCSTEKVQKLVPYLVQSEDQIPGLATYYASTCTECAASCGVHVRTREGRAIKLEGNPDNPISRGRLCARGQAGLQGLYNPDRVRTPMRKEGGAWKAITWDEAIKLLAERFGAAGAGLRIVAGQARGTLTGLMNRVAQAQGGALVRWEAFDRDAERAANQRTFGRGDLATYEFGEARYILSVGADFLETWGSPLEQARGFAQSHGFRDGAMARHVYVGPRMNLTAMNADEWLAPRPGTEVAFVLGVAHAVVARRGGDPRLQAAVATFTPGAVAQATGLAAADIERVAGEFAAAAPSLAVAGGIGAQYPNAVELCAAVNLLNLAAGNIGTTVRFGADPDAREGYAAIRRLQEEMAGGAVTAVLFHEANPVYALPASARFGEALAKVPFKVSTALVLDETAAQCDLLIPNHHALERWDDAAPRAGTFALMQPVMQPVFTTMHTGDVLLKVAQAIGGASAAAASAPSFEALVRATWQQLAAAQKAGDFEAFWRAALQRGGHYAAAPVQPVSLASAQVDATPAALGDGEFVFTAYPTSMLHDGRGTNRPWLVENADPVTKVTWHHWVEVSPATAKRLDVREGEIVRLASAAGTLEGPVYVFPGIRDDVVAVPLGWGHTEYGRYAAGRGANALDLLAAPAGPALPYVTTVGVTKVRNAFRALAKTEGNPRQLGRHIAEAMPLEHAAAGYTIKQSWEKLGNPEHEVNTEAELQAIEGFEEAFAAARELGNYAGEQPMWGLAVDLAKCTGCSACVTACYAENNIPVVGEEEVLRGREMTWIRIERYWEGGTDGQPVEGRVVPMMCQHCDAAPCEPVCPVYAAYHTPDGLNGQVYNRCVGTRYCANNCPYKVRYFNWKAYNWQAFPEPLDLQLNPDVTVRARGVMEKCTFCVQRIREAQHRAKLEGRPLRDGEFTVACAQACPSDALVFGDMHDPESRVRSLKQSPRGYHVLELLNVRPAVTYLAKVNHRPAPAAAAGHGAEESH